MFCATLDTRLKNQYFIPFLLLSHPILFLSLKLLYIKKSYFLRAIKEILEISHSIFFYRYTFFFINKTHFYEIIQEILEISHSTFLSQFFQVPEPIWGELGIIPNARAFIWKEKYLR